MLFKSVDCREEKPAVKVEVIWVPFHGRFCSLTFLWKLYLKSRLAGACILKWKNDEDELGFAYSNYLIKIIKQGPHYRLLTSRIIPVPQPKQKWRQDYVNVHYTNRSKGEVIWNKGKNTDQIIEICLDQKYSLFLKTDKAWKM